MPHFGKFLGKEALEVLNYKDNIETNFMVNVEDDMAQVHPCRMCFKCYSTMRNIEQRETTSQLQLKQWGPHTDTCDTCSVTTKFLSCLYHTGRRDQ